MKKWFVGTLAAITVLYYAVTVLRYAYNFPYMDDYPVVVNFLNRLPNAGTFGEKVALLLEQNNFHRLVLAKLIALAEVTLTGSVDFRVMQYVGLGALLGTAWLLWRSSESPGSDAIPSRNGIAKAEVRLACFLPVLFLLFQFQGWNVAFWSIVAVSNVGAPALALLAFYLAHRGREGWAVGVGLVALFTNGNGILVLPLLTICWLIQQRWRWAASTLAGTLVALIFYFQNYQNPSGTPLLALFSPEKVVHLLALDTAFLGALVYHPAVLWLPILLGSATVGWMLYLIWVRYDRQNPTLFWLLIFLHLTGLMLAVNRIQNDTSIVFASRYRNITALHIAATYLSMAEVLFRANQVRVQNWFTGLATLATAALWLVSNVTYQSKIERFRELKQTDNLLWVQAGQVRGCAPQYDPVQQLSIMAERQTFRPDRRDQSLTALQSRPAAVAPNTTPGDSLQYKVDVNLRREQFLLVSGWAKVAGRKANFNDTYLGVKTATGWQYYTTLFHQRLDNEDSANDKDTGFTAIISITNVPDSLAIFVKSGRFAAKATILNKTAD